MLAIPYRRIVPSSHRTFFPASLSYMQRVTSMAVNDTEILQAHARDGAWHKARQISALSEVLVVAYRELDTLRKRVCPCRYRRPVLSLSPGNRAPVPETEPASSQPVVSQSAAANPLSHPFFLCFLLCFLTDSSSLLLPSSSSSSHNQLQLVDLGWAKNSTTH
ncbi:predicted protein [Histoplasma capsulatum G186AR]|uniref:Uncharacterized protein n=1 Tax=Ajellomyces capsulatus (strain G186AR / H82 / ATCC MYA-2454 / RMSCC 2432) TaxID=447093 RepID=C0NTB6_AJECG|nr:uncharacterized protein HCBG_06396 [Histoplasma capsulatum G186AR]EEH05277.1 predicted protein [Histoplasma capsulatum G186AR]